MIPRTVQILLCFSSLAFAQADFAVTFDKIRKEANPRELYGFLYDMPKGGDIHHHGSLAPLAEEWLRAATDPAVTKGNEFYVRLRFNACPDSPEPFVRYQTIARYSYKSLSECVRQEFVALTKLTADQQAAFLSSLKLDEPVEGRDEFFERAVLRVRGLARDPNLLFEVMARYIQRYGREGLRYLESQVDPSNSVDQDGNLIRPDQYAGQLREMLSRPEVKASGVTVRLQLPILRFARDAEKKIEDAYEIIDRHRDLWVGVNLVGREDNDKGYALRFLSTFRKMRRKYSGIHLSIHGGEVDSPGHEVRNTLLLGAERIGHGVNLITDPEAMLLMRNGRNLVEVNLVSNLLLEYVSDYGQHPFPEYLRFGIPVCLNTDDAGVWDSNITDEYFTAVRNYNLSWDEIVQLSRNSLTYSFAQPAVKRQLLSSFNSAIKGFEDKYQQGNWREKIRQVRPAISGYALRRMID